MTEFQNKSFSVYPGKDGGQQYRDAWDTVFGPKKKKSKYNKPAMTKYLSSAKGMRSVLKRKFRDIGVTEEWFTKTLELQNNSCAICKRKEPGGKGTWHIDHSHELKKPRGLLCQRCNMFLGLAGDSCETLDAASRYVSEWKERLAKPDP